MRLSLYIDGMAHQIDTTDPELLGKWVTEIFARVIAHGPTTATMITAQVYPSLVPDGSPQGSRPDWIADTRIIGNMFAIKSPRDLVTALSEQLDRADMEGVHHG